MKVLSDIKPVFYLKSHIADRLLKLISQGEEDIKHGRTKTQEEVFKNIEKLLEKIK